MPKRLANRFDRLKCHRQLLLCCGFLLLSGWGDRPVVAQSLSPADQLKADRLAQAIYRRPRDGATFNLWQRIYAAHGAESQWVQAAQQRAVASPQSAAAQKVWGLVCEQQHDWQAAVIAFRHATRLERTDYYAWWRLGLSLTRLGDLNAAATAYDACLALKIPRLDRLPIVKQAATILDRLQQRGKAVDLWQSTAAQFSGDLDAQREIATRLQALDADAAALELWQRVLQRSDDTEGRFEARQKIAKLLLATGQEERALALLAGLLGEVEGSSWRAAELRSLVDQSLSRLAPEKVISFWERQLKHSPRDVATRIHLARTYHRLGREAKAFELYRETLRRAPQDEDALQGVVAGLIRRDADEDAVELMRTWVQRKPDLVDRWLSLAELQLRHAQSDTSLDVADAIDSWRHAMAIHNQDASLALQVAEHVRQALNRYQSFGESRDRRLREELESCYREAVGREVNPVTCQALGDFLNQQGRVDEAIAIWRKIADSGSPADWRRVANILAATDQFAAAQSALQQALEINSGELLTWQAWIALLQQQKKHAASVAVAEQMSQQSPRDSRWQRTAAQLAVPGILAQGQADARIQTGQKIISAPDANRYDRWVLALLLDSVGETDLALAQYAELSRADPSDEGTTRYYANRLQAADRYLDAIEQYQRLVDGSTHVNAMDYKRLAELQVAVEQRLAAKESLAKWIVAFPNDPEPHLLAAELATRARDSRQRIAALQKAVDAAPNDLTSRRRYAEALHEAGQAKEALTQVVSALDAAETLPQKLSLISWCATWDDGFQIVQELRPELEVRRLRDPRQYEDATRCLVELLMQVGQQQDALNLLMEIQMRDPSDVAKMLEIVRFAQQADELDTAVRFQREVIKIDDRSDQQQKLARLLRQNQQPLAALEIWDRLLDRSPSADEAVATIVRLVHDRDYYRASQWVEAALSRFPADPRLAYQAMLLHFAHQRWEAAHHSMLEVLRNTQPVAQTEGRVVDALDLLAVVVREDGWYRDIDRRARTYGAMHRRTMEAVFRDELFDRIGSQHVNRMLASAAVAWFRTHTVTQRELETMIAEFDATKLRILLGAAWVTGNASRAGLVMEAIKDRHSVDLLLAVVQLFRRPTGPFVGADYRSQLRQDDERIVTLDPTAADDLGWVVLGLAARERANEDFSQLMADLVSRTSTWNGLADMARLVVHVSQRSPELDIGKPFLQQVERLAGKVPQQFPTRVASASIIDASLELYAQYKDATAQSLATSLPLYAQACVRDKVVEDSPTRMALARLREALDRSVAISPGTLDSHTGSPVREVASLLNQNWDAFLPASKRKADRSIDKQKDEHRFSQTADWLLREDIRRLQRIADRITEPHHLEHILQNLNRAAKRLPFGPAAALPMQGFQIVLLETSGNLRQALPIADQLVVDRPQSTWARMTRVELLIRLNQPTLAQQSLAEILVDQPNLPAAAALRRRLQRHWFDRLHWRDLKGHDGTVTAIAVDPLERWIASVGVDGTVRVWDVSTGKLVRSLQGHDDIVLDVAFSPDGQHLVTGGYDQTVRRWRTNEWVALPVWDGFGATVRSVEYSPDRLQIVVGTDDGKLWLGNAQSDGRPETNWLAHARAVSDAKFSTDSRRIMSSGLDHRINVWEVEGQQLVDKIDFAFSAVRSLELIGNDELLVAVGQDLMHLKRNGSNWQRESHHMGSTIRTLVVLPETGWWCLGSDDRSVQIWNADQAATMATISGHQGRVLSVVAAPSGRWFASAGFGGVIKLWKVDDLVASLTESVGDSREPSP